MEERLSRKKTEYLGCNEHQDAEIHLQGETADTRRVQSGWKNWKSVWSVVRQKIEREDQGEGAQNSGKTSTDVRGRDMGFEEGTGK